MKLPLLETLLTFLPRQRIRQQNSFSGRAGEKHGSSEINRPAIWRRIQVPDCTLDRFHEHIQSTMGWTNSHLHHFEADGQLFGDPQLMEENFHEINYRDSREASCRGGKSGKITVDERYVSCHGSL